MAGETVSIEGIVTYTSSQQGGFNGFYLQQADAETDNDPATSEALFVYTRRKASPGQRLRLTGEVKEFHDLTELVNVSQLSVCGQAPLPEPVELSLPWPHPPERLENMRVSFNAPLTVIEHHNLARFGELTLAQTDQIIPTEYLAPGNQSVQQKLENFQHRVLLDDGKSTRNPVPVPWLDLGENHTIRAGDKVVGVRGVLDYRFGQWRIQPDQNPQFSREEPRPDAPPKASGEITRIMALNLQNYFNGDGERGGYPTPRGARTLNAHNNQLRRLTSVIHQAAADIVAVTELENDGYGPRSALAQLTRALGPAWRFIKTPDRDGSDAIRTALLFRSDRVRPEGEALRLKQGVYRHRGRPPLAQIFTPVAGGQAVRVVVPHLKSKSCRNAKGRNSDQHDGQSCFSAHRTREAQAIIRWLSDLSAQQPLAGTLITGDLNSYAQETPLTTFYGAGFTSLLHHAHPCRPGDCRYHSYRYRGEKGSLDYALANKALMPHVSGVYIWNINADEPRALGYQSAPELNGPWRASDHNPVITDLRL
ncbi:ExeM/NucH family extracellular endonuclease [Marinobacter sp. S0848L]|uniref:ExeM/NucH family extracellular endonuclease n=1 Tax=Marinobacter sp. S0848L TaxID=2926423 RepID=UPI001FF160FA|nr:ExeM/NucH family extracellular endonuclease [Marinobacter sp. S0848L]MCK0106657.1 ExeM/NucH family extracellular endonuclease [Marinobacter sp. S0848L]